MNLNEIRSSSFFRGMSEQETQDACQGLSCVEKRYPKGAVILSAGEPTQRLGLVLSGSVTIENNDLWGNRTILNIIGKGGFFAETYAALENEPVLVDVVANESSRIVFFNIRNLMKTDSPLLSWEFKLTRNLLRISMQKNLALSRRSFHISPKSIRGRVMSYLNTVSLQKHTDEFDIPFDRQQLADYLNVERTALSKELGRMRDEGIISFKKNHFRIILSDM